MTSEDIKHQLIIEATLRVQELCESRGGRPGLSVLMSLTVSVDVKQHRTMLMHWSQFVPNMSTDIRGHEALHNHHRGNFVSRFGLAVRRYAGNQRDLGSNPLRLSFLFKTCGLSCDFVPHN